MLNSLTAPQRKIWCSKSGVLAISQRPGLQNRSVKNIYKFSEAKFWYYRVDLDLSFQMKSNVWDSVE